FVSVNVRLDLFQKVRRTPGKVCSDMADNEEFCSSLLGNSDRFGDTLFRGHAADDYEEIIRCVIKSDIVQIHTVINDRYSFTSQHFRLSPADTYRKAMRKMFFIVVVKFLFYIGISN